MKALTVFANSVAGISLIYMLFEFVPSLLSSDNDAYVIGGIVLIVGVLSVTVPMIVDLINKIRGKN